MKTIGVAVSDELGLAAHPLSTVARRGERADAGQVAELARSRGADVVVVGLPLELSGRQGRRAKRVLRFVEALREELGEAPPIEMWDERFSTVGAERALRKGGVSAKKRKQVVDQQAAAYILQGWLDARRPVEVRSDDE